MSHVETVTLGNGKTIQRTVIHRHIRVHCADGSSYETQVNGTDAEIRQYFIGQNLNFGDTELHPEDLIRQVDRIEFLN